MSAAADAFQQANSLFVDENYEQALEWYNKAIELDAAIAEYYSKRAACFLKLKRFTEAVQDANLALKLEPTSATALLRKGIACFSLEEYESAKMSFEQGAAIEPNNSQFKTWLRKCNAELEEEENDDQPTTTSPVVVAPAATVAAPAPSTAAVSPSPATATATTTTTSSTAPANHSAKADELEPLPSFTRIRHEWYQSDAFVFVSVFAKGVQRENVNIHFSEDNVSISLLLSDSKEWQMEIDVCDRIVPAESSFDIRPTKIEIKLKKSRAAKWNALERAEGTDIAPITAWSDTSAVDKSLYPTSSKKGPKNWDQIASSVEEDKLDGDAALNKVFQDIYSRGSEEQRRAMMKSFVESNGTVLSTNWEDVGSREVKGSPPKGMEMHPWNENQR